MIAALRTALLIASLAVAACSAIDFGDRPGPDVHKQDGPLTAPPAHLQQGGSE